MKKGKPDGSTPKTLNRLPPELARLASLRSLNLYGCGQFSGNLYPLAGLTSLQLLDLSWCEQLSGDLSPLAGLTSLQSLNLAWFHNLGGDLSPLASLTSLQSLDLSGCWRLSGNLSPLPVRSPPPGWLGSARGDAGRWRNREKGLSAFRTPQALTISVADTAAYKAFHEQKTAARDLEGFNTEEIPPNLNRLGSSAQIDAMPAILDGSLKDFEPHQLSASSPSATINRSPPAMPPKHSPSRRPSQKTTRFGGSRLSATAELGWWVTLG
jgi:hypothetical protein